MTYSQVPHPQKPFPQWREARSVFAWILPFRVFLSLCLGSGDVRNFTCKWKTRRWGCGGLDAMQARDGTDGNNAGGSVSRSLSWHSTHSVQNLLKPPSSPKSALSRLGSRALNAERISSRPTFENLFLFEVSSAIGTALKRAVINKADEAPSHTLQLRYSIRPTLGLRPHYLKTPSPSTTAAADTVTGSFDALEHL